MTISSEILEGLSTASIIPYLGPEMLALTPDYDVPATPEVLAGMLTSKVSVPHKIRNRLTQAAQFIENFKHRKTLLTHMNAAFAVPPQASELHRLLAGLGLPLIVDAWYDAAMQSALAGQDLPWGQVQGLSQAEHFGTWTGWYNAAGEAVPDASPDWKTILYKPIGAAQPAANYLISDSDYVEVLTEIDIQTPIPAEVQKLRSGRGFLFLGCRFNDQLTRSFARQIMKRSGTRHWAVLPNEPTRMEKLFLAEQSITRIEMPLDAFAQELLALRHKIPQAA